MIEPIKEDQKEHDETYSLYGVTKFIGKDSNGYRGVIVQNNGKEAMLYVLNGQKTGKMVKVKETNPDQWPIEV